MCTQISLATFPGYQGPFFPDQIEALNKLHRELKPDNEVLSGIGKLFSEFQFLMDLPTTEDGTGWLASLELKFSDGTVVSVLFPHKSDGNSIALYSTKLEVTYLNNIVFSLCRSYRHLLQNRSSANG